MIKKENKNLVKCVNNQGYEVSLLMNKNYQVLDDDEAKALGVYRIIDETNEDYLYPKVLFEEIED